MYSSRSGPTAFETPPNYWNAAITDLEERIDRVTKGHEGAALLNDVYTFLGRFVAYPSIYAHVAHVLWIAHRRLSPRGPADRAGGASSRPIRPAPGSGCCRCCS